MKFGYRTARETDRDMIYCLYRQVMRPLIAQIWAWDETWQRQDFDKYFVPEDIRLVHEHQTLVGYSQTEKRERQLYLRMLVVDAHCRRQGVGRTLLGRIIDEAAARFDEVGLEVFRINTAAKSFYEKFGFRQVGDTDASLVMVLPLARDNDSSGARSELDAGVPKRA